MLLQIHNGEWRGQPPCIQYASPRCGVDVGADAAERITQVYLLPELKASPYETAGLGCCQRLPATSPLSASHRPKTVQTK
jgi:hypothetical protein